MTDIADKIQDFLVYLKYEKQYSCATLKNYNLDLIKFNIHLLDLDIFMISEITNSHIQNYINKLNRAGLMATSLSRKTSSIRSFFNFMIKKRIIKSNPSKKNNCS